MRNTRKKLQKIKEINLKIQNTWLFSLFLNTVIGNNSKTRHLLSEQDKKYPLEEFSTKYAHII